MKFKDLKNTWLSSNFKEHFGDMDFEIPNELKLQTKKLECPMLDPEILKEFKPQEGTLGELAYAIKNVFDKDSWYIMYIRDAKGTLWAVDAYWDSSSREWDVFAYSVESPDGWSDGRRVVSQQFNVSSGNSGSRIVELLDGLEVNIK